MIFFYFMVKVFLPRRSTKLFYFVILRGLRDLRGYIEHDLLGSGLSGLTTIAIKFLEEKYGDFDLH